MRGGRRHLVYHMEKKSYRMKWTKKKRQILFPALLGIVLAAAIFIPKRQRAEKALDEIEVTDSTEVRDIVYKYGIPTDDYDVDYGLVKKNQTLSAILNQHGMTLREVHRLSQAAKGIFNMKKIRKGQSYAVFTTRDSIPRMAFFVYEEDAKSYVLFDLRDEEYHVSRGENPVEWVRKEARGRVESSLWVAMQNGGTDPQLAVILSQIFGWTIDFFGLQKNDEFRVIYEQEQVDGKSLQNFHVLAASFKQGDSTHYAIPFEQDGEVLYYNDRGNSLEGAFLKAPLDFFRISSRFSNSRFHPVLKRYRPHHGVDYAAPTGTPVYAVGSGKVIAKGYQANGGGNYVKIKHNSIYVTTYMHLSRFAKGLKVGSQVAQKEVIGYVGATGIATGPHLDFRVHEYGRPINPLSIKSQPKKPISRENMPQFILVRDALVEMLDEIDIPAESETSVESGTLDQIGE